MTVDSQLDQWTERAAGLDATDPLGRYRELFLTGPDDDVVS